MQELVVLGLIPGTNIQITFIMWLLAIMLGFGFFIAHIAKKRHLVQNTLVTVALIHQTRRARA